LQRVDARFFYNEKAFGNTDLQAIKGALAINFVEQDPAPERSGGLTAYEACSAQCATLLGVAK